MKSLWISYCIAQHISGHPSNFSRNCSSCPKLSSNFNSGHNPLSFQLNQMHMQMLCGQIFLFYIIPFLCLGVPIQMTLSLTLLTCVIIVQEPVLRKNNNGQNQPVKGEGSEGQGNCKKSGDEKMRQKVRRQR